jgi:hypothetical protein
MRSASIDDYLAAVCARVREVVGERLVGVWLTGSAALGDFDPARSDLDVQAIATERLARAELERLAGLLDHRALPCPARGLELVLYAREDLCDPAGPAFQLNLDTGARMKAHVGLDPALEPRFWFTLDVSIARQAAVALIGPPAAEAFPEPGRALVLAAARESLRWHAEHDPAGGEAAACRTRAWLADGRWRSKREALAWAAATESR